MDLLLVSNKFKGLPSRSFKFTDTVHPFPISEKEIRSEKCWLTKYRTTSHPRPPVLIQKKKNGSTRQVVSEKKGASKIIFSIVPFGDIYRLPFPSFLDLLSFYSNYLNF